MHFRDSVGILWICSDIGVLTLVEIFSAQVIVRMRIQLSSIRVYCPIALHICPWDPGCVPPLVVTDSIALNKAVSDATQYWENHKASEVLSTITTVIQPLRLPFLWATREL